MFSTTFTVKALLLLLLITSFSLGILLVQTAGERDVVTTDLKNAKAIIKEKDGTIRDEQNLKEAAKADFDGCSAKVEQQNKQLAEQALAGISNNDKADARANLTLSLLPTQIVKDQLSAKDPVLASQWMKGLFQ